MNVVENAIRHAIGSRLMEHTTMLAPISTSIVTYHQEKNVLSTCQNRITFFQNSPYFTRYSCGVPFCGINKPMNEPTTRSKSTASANLIDEKRYQMRSSSAAPWRKWNPSSSSTTETENSLAGSGIVLPISRLC